jgi:Calcineurin-like phosphoesterase superfamily domain
MHGNALALDAVLAELEREHVDEIVCLGDVAQGGAQPAEVVDRLRELGCRSVFGNSDEFLITLDPEATGRLWMRKRASGCCDAPSGRASSSAKIGWRSSKSSSPSSSSTSTASGSSAVTGRRRRTRRSSCRTRRVRGWRR